MIHNSRIGFYTDIEKGFSSLINQLGFQIIYKEANRKVILSNQRCIVELRDTEDSLEIWLRDPKKPNIEYWPNQVYESLGNEIRIPWNIDKSDSYVEQYTQMSQALMTYLSNVLNGDFDWVETYQALEAEELKLIKQLSKLDNSHPIKQSFRQQKLSWKEEARKLL